MGIPTQTEFFDCTAASELLTHELRRVVRTFRLDARRLARVLAMDEGDAAELLAGHQLLRPSSPEGLRTLRLVRLHRALGDAFGTLDAVEWFMTHANGEDGAIPAALLEEPDGIERLFARLDCQGVDQWRPREFALRVAGGV
ncbi:hypothetical protein [Cognatilysobacter terrigena]|uniref:hypothetical protein n=1 Tax=Cognatilysobacter terrigena TaxID=2488749 RepID=UPI001AAE12DC|nr:hypothetical protein [Lysobacter terrigena]